MLSSTISLTNAVTSGDEGTVTALLAKGADVNETTGGGQTALILAVIFGHTNLVKLLVNAGADPQLHDNLGLNAIEWAKRRGSREALEILTGTPQSTTAPVFEIEEPVQPVVQATPPAREPEIKETVADDEKSRRWLAGLRQRLDEQEIRRSNRSEEIETAPVEPVKPPEPDKPLIVRPAVARIFEAPDEVPPTGGKRKRCPRCNAIYNGDLLSYCAHHIVPLVDFDEPIITDTPPRATMPLFWILVLVTLSGSIVVGTIVSTYLYRSNQAANQSAAGAPTIQKGFPELGPDLAGKAVLLPEAECPLSGSDLLTGTVTVSVKIDRNGQVSRASGSGGDWLMRGAATEAAMKSTFSPEKLRGREIEGTITYTFKPQ